MGRVFGAKPYTGHDADMQIPFPKPKPRSVEFQEGAWTQRDHDALNDRMIEDEKNHYRREDEFEPHDE